MYLSIIIPAYNEEKRIQTTLMEVGDFLVQQNYDYEVIVVNDGSSDKTLENAKAANAVVIRHPHNIGYGRSLKDGILKAKNDIIDVFKTV